MEDLTLIRIRGKKYRPGQKPPQAPKRPRRQKDHANSISLPTKKPRIRTSEASSPRHLSLLESLPPEILQHIFHLCPNTNLPAATLTLGRKLSSPSLKKDFFLALFLADENSIHHRNNLYSTYTVSPHVLPESRTELKHLIPSGDPAQKASTLQSLCLRQRWLTYPFVKEALQSAALLPQPQDNPPPPTTSAPLHHYLSAALCLERNVRIPSKLLHGPWTIEKGDFLHFLHRSNASIDYINSTDGEIFSSSLTQAIREGDKLGVQIILGQGRWSLSEESGTNGTGRPCRSVGITVTTEHLRAAVFEGGCRKEVVMMLLKVEDTGIDGNDGRVWDWILRRKAEGDERGHWLERRLGSWVQSREEKVKMDMSEWSIKKFHASADERLRR